MSGKFLFGRRKRSPWVGFAKMMVENNVDTAE